MSVRPPPAKSEIQTIGTRGRTVSNPSPSLFRADISVDHPLKILHVASFDLILNTFISWFFPTRLLSYSPSSSYISDPTIIKKLQVNSIKGCLGGIQLFHKLIYSSPAPHMANSQTALLIKGIQRTHPTRQDTRQPITLKNILIFIKQSKTDLEKRDHYIYIFNLQSPICLYQTLPDFYKSENHKPLPYKTLFSQMIATAQSFVSGFRSISNLF